MPDMDKIKIKELSPLPPRGGWAPGDYLCKCDAGHRTCGCTFMGDKYAHQCADCAYVVVGTIGVITSKNFDRGTDEGTEPEANDMNDDFVEELLEMAANLQRDGKTNAQIIEVLDKLSNPSAYDYR